MGRDGIDPSTSGSKVGAPYSAPLVATLRPSVNSPLGADQARFGLVGQMVRSRYLGRRVRQRSPMKSNWPHEPAYVSDLRRLAPQVQDRTQKTVVTRRRRCAQVREIGICRSLLSQPDDGLRQ